MAAWWTAATRWVGCAMGPGHGHGRAGRRQGPLLLGRGGAVRPTSSHPDLPSALPSLPPPPQGLVLLLCALGPEEMSEVRLGPLTPHAVRTLRHIREFFNVQFK